MITREWTFVPTITAHAARCRMRQPVSVRFDVLESVDVRRLPAWRTDGSVAPMVAIITHYRGPQPDKIALFRRILTVTKLMCLAGNKPKLRESLKGRNA